MDFLTENDCILYGKAEKHFLGKIRRTIFPKATPTTHASTYLTLIATQTVPARCETLLQGQLRNDDNSKTHGYEDMTALAQSLQDSSEFRVAQTVVRDIEENCWVRLLILHNGDIVTYKSSRVRILESFEFEHRTFSVKTEPTENDKK